jgi:stage V sporulation protein SpoVS
MTAFENGYRAFAAKAGADLSALGSVAYISNVENAINELEHFINVDLRNKGIRNPADIIRLKGYAAEYWHGGTHNINAAVEGVSARVEIRQSSFVASPDIVGSWKDSNFSLKYNKFGGDRDNHGYPVDNNINSAFQQSETYRGKYEAYRSRMMERGRTPSSYEEYYKYGYDEYLRECREANRVPQSINEVFPGYKNPDNPMYMGQYRIVAKENLEEAQAWLHRRILEESNGGRAEQVYRYKETLDKLTDRIKSNEGSESIPLTIEEAEELARLAKEGKFDPAAATWNLTPEELIKWQHIVKQARQAGMSASVITCVLEVAPELINVLTALMRDGEFNADDFKRVGFAAIKGASLGYVRGHVAASITIMCNAGKLGSTLKNTDPTIIGAVVALTMNTLQNAVAMSFGYMDKHGFANKCVQDFFTTSFSLVAGFATKKAIAKFAGAAMQALLPQLPMLGFMLGSFIGGVIGSFAHQKTHMCILSFCVNSGCTFFGIVKQDYTLPKEIQEELGLEVFEYEKFVYEKFNYEEFSYEPFQYETFEYETIDIRILRRGVIGVNIVCFV